MKVNMLRTLENIITESIRKEGDSVDETAKKAIELFENIKQDLIENTQKSNNARQHELLVSIRDEYKRYQCRILERWKPALDHLEVMWQIACELGQNHGIDVKETDDEYNNEVMAALANIFPKSLLTTREIISLLEAGYPDGALARWRSLHELSISAMYIAKHGIIAAKQYQLSYYFSTYRAALQINEYSERSGIKKFSKKELDNMERLCEKARSILGINLNPRKAEWPAITGKKNFFELEKDVAMDHWRPWYKWASNYIHSSHRPLEDLLGNREASIHAHLVGPSDFGFVDPFQLTAISLSQLVTTYLNHTVNMDRLIHLEIFHSMAKEMSVIAIKCAET